MKVKVSVTQWCPTLCNPMHCSPPGSSVRGILQTRILEWVVISSSRGSSWSRVWTMVSYIVDRFFIVWATREAPRIVIGNIQNVKLFPSLLLKTSQLPTPLFMETIVIKNGSHLQAFPAPPRLSCLIPPHKVFWFSLTCCFSKKQLCPAVT